MARASNIFHNLVTEENSTTRLLCNLMTCEDSRRLLLARLLSPDSAATIECDDVAAQVGLKGYGRPDIFIQNQRIRAIIELKVTRSRALTGNQPDRYFSSLSDLPNFEGVSGRSFETSSN
jgi:hypothetical protein